MVDRVSKHTFGKSSVQRIFVKPKRINQGQLCRCGSDRMKEGVITFRQELNASPGEVSIATS